MELRARSLQAIVFDYGNTLVEFSRHHVDHCDAALGQALRERFGPLDAERFHRLREASRMAPYRVGNRERGLAEISQEMVQSLYGRAPSAAELDFLVELRRRVFVEVVVAEPETLTTLRALRGRFRLAVVSNYPCGRSIRDSLVRVGIAPLLDAVVVSGELGYAKPHPAPFQAVCAALACDPGEVLFVGDNWLADVQGARRAGMQMARLRRWTPPEHFEPAEGDEQPHATLDRLDELLALV